MSTIETTTDALSQISLPSRVADSGETVGLDELGLATRNHGMPLELMRHDVTPLGSHYLLTHYDIPAVDLATWRLEVTGLVRSLLSLSLDDLKSRHVVTRTVTLECAGNGRARLDPRPVSQPWLNEAIGTMTWTGTPLASLLDEAGLDGRAVDLVFTGADHGVERGVEQDYARSMSVEDARRDDVMLAWTCNGVDLPPQHGYPLRLLVPGWYGMASVKWLRRIDVIDEAYDGYQMRAYRLRQQPDEPGEPLTKIAPRALVVPPGFPDFLSRTRVLRPGRHLLEGRAWSGYGAITSVEVTVDDGLSWAPAVLDPPLDTWAWRRWSLPWQVDTPTGTARYVVSARATDETGRSQPTEAAWNRGGFANTSAQRVPVVVLAE